MEKVGNWMRMISDNEVRFLCCHCVSILCFLASTVSCWWKRLSADFHNQTLSRHNRTKGVARLTSVMSAPCTGWKLNCIVWSSAEEQLRETSRQSHSNIIRRKTARRRHRHHTLTLTLWRVRLFMSQPFVNLYGKSLAGHIPLHVPVCVFPLSHTHFPVSVTSSNTLRRKKSLINVGRSSKQTHGLICEQTHTAEEKWSLKVLFSQFYTNHLLFISQNMVWSWKYLADWRHLCVWSHSALRCWHWGETRGSNPQQLLPLLWTPLYCIQLIQFISQNLCDFKEFPPPN